MPERTPAAPSLLRHCGKPGALLLVAAAILVSSAVPAPAQSGPPNGLPDKASVQAKVRVEGDLEAGFECDEHESRLKHFLRLPGGRRLALKFAGPPPELPDGSRVRVEGEYLDDSLAVADGTSVEALALASANSFGDRKVAVILVNFQDNPSAPYTPASIYTTTFQTVSDFYLENSYGQTSLSGDVFGWFTIPMDSTTCDTAKIRSLAEQAAVNQGGAKLSSYAHRVYAFPKVSACSWLGYGSVGGNPSWAFINGSYTLRVVAHELGHNFGLYHSHSMPCSAGNCSAVEYGDTRDVMGQTTAHVNAFQKERLGWLAYAESPSIQTVTASGSYWIDGYVPPGAAPKALKVLKGLDSYGSRTWYYFEARTKSGFDAAFTPAVMVHAGSESSGNSSYQIDLDPETSTFGSMLLPGQTFSDSTLGLNVTPLWIDASGAMVDVTMAAAPCVTGAPAVTLSPSSLWTKPGVAAGANLAVKNNDGAGCGASTFTLASAVPSGWSSAFGSGSLTIEPGASATASLTITPPATANGQYGFSTAASRVGQSASAGGTVVVSNGLDVALSVGALSKGSYPLTATVKSGGAPVSGAAVTFVVINPAGGSTTLSATSNTSGVAATKWRPKKNDPAGVYQIQVTASANGITGTASGTLVR